MPDNYGDQRTPIWCPYLATAEREPSTPGGDEYVAGMQSEWRQMRDSLAATVAERDRLAAQLREAEAALATEREARNRIARENADRIGRAIDADKAAVVEFARAVLADRNWYCHDNGLDDAPIVREMAEQIEEGNSRGLIDLVMNALREAQAATRRECAEMVRRSIGPGDGAWVRRLDGLADRIERGPAEPAASEEQ